MDILEEFFTRVSKNHAYSDSKSSFMYNLGRDFEQSLKMDPSSIKVEIHDVEKQNDKFYLPKTVDVIINDVSKNDQKSFDEKFILTRVSDGIKFGTYIKFDDFYWVVNFQENQTHKVYYKYVIRRCNKIVKFNHNDKIYNIPVVVKNLTQYSDGMQDIKYTSISDNKIALMFGINSITKKFDLGDRLIIGKNAYRTTFIEDYQFNKSYDTNEGLGNLIMIYDPKHSNDDIEKGITNDNTVNTSGIKGSDKLIPQGSFIYKYDGDNEPNMRWNVAYDSDRKDFITLENKTSDDEVKVKLKVDDDTTLIGQQVRLQLFKEDLNLVAERKLSVTVF